MTAKLTLSFGIVLLAIVLVSRRARDTVLSTAVIALGAGWALGSDGLGWLHLAPTDPLLNAFAETALYAVLFVDGSRLNVGKLRLAWHLPGRALLLGLPLTVAGLSLADHVALRMAWLDAALVAAILSPTDPVFAAAVIERDSVPHRLRTLLSVESGLNDGLALPLVLVFLHVRSGSGTSVLELLRDVMLGLLVGVCVPFAYQWLERRAFFEVSEEYHPLAGVGLALAVFGMCEVLGANEFLAAFSGGLVFGNQSDRSHAERFLRLGEPLAEAAKLVAVFVFGTVLTRSTFAALHGVGIVWFAAVALVLVRPAALLLALLGHPLPTREWLAASWFGPKGFASILYGVMLLHSSVPEAEYLFAVVAAVAAVSIVVHSSTDVLVARAFTSEPS